MRWLAVVVTFRPNASRLRACMDSESVVSETGPSLDMVKRPTQRDWYKQDQEGKDDKDEKEGEEEEEDWTEQKLFKTRL